MKKITIGVVIAIILALIIFNLPKNTPEEELAEEKPISNNVSSQDKVEKTDLTQSNNVRYLDYSKTSFGQMSIKKRVYFFHAKWCPTCKTANEEFTQDADKIPNDVILFKTDYDTEKELKTQYGITYQHTFVYVDNSGKEIKKWNGGGITDLISNTLDQ